VQELLKRVPGLEVLRHPVIITDTAGVVTFWNDAAEQVLGWRSDDALGQPLNGLVTLQPAADELVQRIQADPQWSGEMALRRREGTAFLARVHHISLTDDLGHVAAILTVVIDITDATWARQRGQEQGERARRALDAAGVGSWHLDLTSGLATWDGHMETLFGLPRGTFPGTRRDWLRLIHEGDREWVVEEVRRAAASGGQPVDVEYRVATADGSTRWINCVGRTFDDGSGETRAISGVAFDITERRRADEERAAFLASERARRDRFTLLAEASAAFSESLDDEDVMAAVGKLAVPRLADWFAIDLVEPTGIRTAAAVHHDAGRRDMITALSQRYGAGHGVVPDVTAVVGHGRARLLADVDLAAWPQVARNPEHRAALARVGVQSLMIVPLTARGRTFGAMTFAISDSDIAYSPEDLDLASDLARRAALSIDNARLYADRTHVARVLQRSLLPPELPEVPGVQVAARYRAAVAGSDIGGDFYDVFETSENRWNLVLGDVSGKGTDAAVLTGLARHTLRAAAMRADGPVEVLSALNHAVLAPEYGERFLTVVYVQMRLLDDRAELVVACAGHPDPLVVRTDGTVEPIDTRGGAIGLFDDVEIDHRVVELREGDVMVLYTDGVLEARNSRGDFYGDARLRALLSEFPGRPPEELAERIEAAVMTFQDGTPRDDIAVLAVKLGHQHTQGGRG